jgi:single-stranded-DNA-specific exonuclease
MQPLTLTSIEQRLQGRFEHGFLTLKDLPQPSLFKDMDRATARIVEAIRAKEKITIIGDYDVDGVTSTTLMKLFFEEINYPISWIIPNRFRDGYGLSSKIIPRILGTHLAITVDNGISAFEAGELCKAHGIDLIITDHHLLPPKIPDCYAIIDQKQEACSFPYEEVCGAQIAWYLIASIKNALGLKIDMIAYMELVAIAIIADMMPLHHINRVMVEVGLQSLSKSQRPAIRAYRDHTQKECFSSEDIGFFLAPILNSAGRMEDASTAVAFLTSTNIYDARVRLERLIGVNDERKRVEQEITQEALSKVDREQEVIVVDGVGWHEGVVGIVAARVARHYEKPTIVLTHTHDGVLKGSGRSFSGCDLFSITNACRNHLEKFGGHHSAIGLSLKEEALEPFKEALQEAFFESNTPIRTHDPDLLGILPFGAISFELMHLIRRYEPYGQGNPQPKFISETVRLLQIESMGKEGEHQRFVFEQAGIEMQGVKFKSKENYTAGALVEVIYTLNENHFRGRVTLQLMVEKIISLP